MTSKPPSNLEPTDVNPRAVAITGVVVLLFLVAGGFIVAGIRACNAPEGPRYRHAAHSQKQRFQRVEAPEQQGPGVPIDPAKKLREVRRREASLLHQYRWADENHQVARIPIDRAMEILAESSEHAELPEEKP